MSDNNISHDSTDCDELSIPSTDDVSDLVDALDGIGISRARALVMAGIDSVACLAACDPASIGKLPSFGGTTAHDVVGQARTRESVAESQPEPEPEPEPEPDTDSEDDSVEELETTFEPMSESESESESEIDPDSAIDNNDDSDVDADSDSGFTDTQTDIKQWSVGDSDESDDDDDSESSTQSRVGFDAVSGDELKIAVVGHQKYGNDMMNKDAVNKVRDAIDASPIAFEDIDRIICPDKNHGSEKVREFAREHNRQFDFEHTDNLEEKMIRAQPVNTPWDETDGVPEDELSEGMYGDDIWSEAPQARNDDMADIADALIIVDDGRDFGEPWYAPFLSDMKVSFSENANPIFNYSEYCDTDDESDSESESESDSEPDEVDIESNGS
jgi:clumping factor B